ncbi:MAG: hypothetical protein HGB36_03275 [Chlorobiaceae bacterium]|nr:hypothetical protein [Chlorobiaceae bacterium]
MKDRYNGYVYPKFFPPRFFPCFHEQLPYRDRCLSGLAEYFAPATHLLKGNVQRPLRSRCPQVPQQGGSQTLTKLFLREEKLYIAPVRNPDDLKQVSLSKYFRILGIVRKVVREQY